MYMNISFDKKKKKKTKENVLSVKSNSQFQYIFQKAYLGLISASTG